jgi:hypothetical protein
VQHRAGPARLLPPEEDGKAGATNLHRWHPSPALRAAYSLRLLCKVPARFMLAIIVRELP